MILTVTCNPAVDVTYELDRLVPGAVHRVGRVRHRLGGKGVNAARVLHTLGEPVHAVGLGDATFGRRLTAEGVPATFVEAMPEVRRTLVVHAGETTSLWEPGPAVTPEAGDRLAVVVAELLREARALVVSGSLPPGLPADLPVRLAALARERGVPALLDVDDDALAAAARNGGAVLTPNADELEGLMGEVREPVVAVRALASATGAPVVHTRGADGVLVVDGDECWSARLTAVRGNPTGAGDAVAAGIARGLARKEPWPDLLRHAVALGAAAVLAPGAGEVDVATYQDFLPRVRVSEQK